MPKLCKARDPLDAREEERIRRLARSRLGPRDGILRARMVALSWDGQRVPDIAAALEEIHRVLRPGGTLVLTLDNLSNPVVALRNALPYSLTHAAGLVPYPVGKTHGPQGARRLVENAGLIVAECTAVMHAPRVVAVPFARLIEKWGGERLQDAVSRALLAFERLRPLPTAFVTGHFVAIRATRAL